MKLTIKNARVCTPEVAGSGYARGESADARKTIERGEVVIESGVIRSVRAARPTKADGAGGGARVDRLPALAVSGGVEDRVIDAGGRALLPGFVDCHTHACFAGSRIDEWEMKRRGVPYLEILKRGGGIMSTVRAVREAPVELLAELLRERLEAMLRLGTTTIEVKSGYGLTGEAELKMLRAIRRAGEGFAGTVVPTALLGHAVDESVPGFIGVTIRQTLPSVAAEFPGVTVDAFCEQGAWSVEQCVLLFTRCRELGLPFRVHADQFNSLGMLPAAVRLEAVSVDHLEATVPADLELLAGSATAGVMLPACGFHLDNRYARGRKFIAAGGAAAIATNYNPGSAPCWSMPMVVALAVRHLGLSAAEALNAASVNAARVLGLRDRGTIAAGQRGDLVLLRSSDERSVAFEFGSSPVEAVIAGGRLVE